MKISEIILDWYKKNKRNLPWRNTRDPYKIWVSEIILQQTRVDQGISYYYRFIERFPDLKSLALADENEVIKLWQGLGYYSRARNMHFAAKQIRELHNGVFPDNYLALLSLKGVGPYTAAAVASFSFDEPVALVDGNVSRVLSRLFAISEPINSTKGQKIMKELATEILNKSNPAEHNQAIMEFGALLCGPILPICAECPLLGKCAAYKSSAVKDFPVKIKKSPVKFRYFTYLILKQDGSTYLNKRTENDIWKQMFEFPLMEHPQPLEIKNLEEELISFGHLNKTDYIIRAVSEPIKHQLSHRTIYARFVHIDVLNPQYAGLPNWTKVSLNAVSEFPIPRLIDRYIGTNLYL